MPKRRIRWRSPKAKPGELKLVYRKLPDENPDICTVWGDGAGHNGADSALLFNVFCNKRTRFDSKILDPSFVDELKERGYDITTIKFSIQKKSVSE